MRRMNWSMQGKLKKRNYITEVSSSSHCHGQINFYIILFIYNI